MGAALISRARMHDLVRLGRSRPGFQAASGLPAVPSASRRQPATDALGIGGDLPSRPRATSSRPETDDLTAATI